MVFLMWWVVSRGSFILVFNYKIKDKEESKVTVTIVYSDFALFFIFNIYFWGIRGPPSLINLKNRIDRRI